MFSMLERVIRDVSSRGPCVIVGRGSTYFLRERPDAFHAFIYAPLDEKLRRVRSLGKSEKEARQLIEEIDRERAAFIRHYFNSEWPYRPLYHLMINSQFGDEYVVETLLRQIASVEKNAPHEVARA